MAKIAKHQKRLLLLSLLLSLSLILPIINVVCSSSSDLTHQQRLDDDHHQANGSIHSDPSLLSPPSSSSSWSSSSNIPIQSYLSPPSSSSSSNKLPLLLERQHQQQLERYSLDSERDNITSNTFPPSSSSSSSYSYSSSPTSSFWTNNNNVSLDDDSLVKTKNKERKDFRHQKRRRRFVSSPLSSAVESAAAAAAVVSSSSSLEDINLSTRLISTNANINKNNKNNIKKKENGENNNDGDIRKSSYVCEDGQLELSCHDNGKHIDVLRANFGRFSITLCNPSGFLDWSVNCASGNSILPILIERCAKRSKCSIEASSSIFGDPCPGTSKYLEVHYRCTSGIEKINSHLDVNNKSATTSTIAGDSNIPPLLSSTLIPTRPSDYLRKLQHDGLDGDNNNNINVDHAGGSDEVQGSTTNNNNIKMKHGTGLSNIKLNKNNHFNPKIVSDLNHINDDDDGSGHDIVKNELIFSSSSSLDNHHQDNQEKHHQTLVQPPKPIVPSPMIPVPKFSSSSFDTTASNDRIPNHSSILPKSFHQQQQHNTNNSNQNSLNKDLLHRSIECQREPGSSNGGQQQPECIKTTIMAASDDDDDHSANWNDSIVRRPMKLEPTSINNNGNKWPSETILTNDGTSSSSSLSSTSSMSTTCDQIIYRDIQWPPTPSGSIAIRPCPHDTSGLAQWKCGTTINHVGISFENINSHFSNLKPWKTRPSQSQLSSTTTTSVVVLPAPSLPSSSSSSSSSRAVWIHLPDLSQCYSRWILQLNSFQNVNNFRNDMWRSILANVQHSPPTIYGGDIIQLLDLLENWFQRFFSQQQQQTKQNQIDRFQNNQINGFDSIFEILSQLLSQNHQPTWFDLPEPKRELAALNLMDVSIKYMALYCLNKRQNHAMKDNELIKQSTHLFFSCFSISKSIHEFQLNQNNQSPSSTNQSEFRHELFSSFAANPNSKVSVALILNATNMESQLLSENIYLAMLVPVDLENYFQLPNGNFLMEQYQENGGSQELHGTFLDLIDLDQNHHLQIEHQTFINSQIIKFIRFNNEEIFVAKNIERQPQPNNYAFEIIFKHLVDVVDDNVSDDVVKPSLQHQCVQWDESLKHWSSEHCTLIGSNATHSICSCQSTVSVCTILAIGQSSPFWSSTYNSTNNNNEMLDGTMGTTKWPLSNNKLALAKHYGSLMSLTLIIYIWIALILIRYHSSYFNQSNFIPLLMICIVRTMLEITSIITIKRALWWSDWSLMMVGDTGHDDGDRISWCPARMFFILYQLQVICSLFSVFFFQNVIILLLANKIYLTKNYINTLEAIKRSRFIQILVSIVFPLVHLASIYCLSRNYFPDCWPFFDPIISALFVTSPVLQITLVLTSGVIYLHCSQRIFSEYDFPTHLQCFQSDTSAMEKHIKEIFFNRCKHITIWIVCSVIYLFLVVGCLCCTLFYRHTSYAMIGIDIAISLTFLLFARMKYLFNLIVKCGRHGHRSSSKNVEHCYNNANSLNIIGGQESASSSIDSKQTRDNNSISILSDTSKTFLTLPHGQISSSSASVLGSPKIYPSSSILASHQSSCIYGNGTGAGGVFQNNVGGRNSNPSSHLYESPSHLYNYEYERRYYGQNGVQSSSTHNMFQQQQQLPAVPTHKRRPFYALDAMNVPIPPPSSAALPSIHRLRDSNMSLNRIGGARPHLTSKHQQYPSTHGTTSTTTARTFSFDRPVFS